MKNIISTGLALSLALLTTGCFKEKDIPAEQLITIYDSNLKETNKLAPLETMYVKIAGLAPNQTHKIEILDPNKKLISEAEVKSNEEGVIEPLPIWYDIGLEKQDDNKTYAVTKKDLSLKAFYVKVTSLENKDTEFEQNFFLLLKKPKKDDMHKSIVSSVSAEDGNLSNATIENAFFETGSKTEDGSDSNLTKVYVKADQLPYHTIKDGEETNATKVDIYVVPFSGGVFDDGMDLEDFAVISRKNVETNVSKDNNYRYLKPTLIWDLNRAPKLINPGDSNNAYSIIIDTNQNGKFDIGEDLDGDGKYDRYIDGIDGQGAAGFIVMDTEANTLNYSITDGHNNRMNAISENESGDKTELYFEMNNIPTSEKNVTLYVIDKDATNLEDGLDLSDAEVRNNDGQGTDANISEADNKKTFMPYIASSKLLNTQDDSEYGYTESVKDKKPLDVVVDINKDGKFTNGVDYYLPNVLNILPYDANVTTTADQQGTEETTAFNEAKSETNTTVYIKYGEDNSTKDCKNKHFAYLYKASEAPTEGQELFGQILRKE